MPIGQHTWDCIQKQTIVVIDTVTIVALKSLNKLARQAFHTIQTRLENRSHETIQSYLDHMLSSEQYINIQVPNLETVKKTILSGLYKL